MKKGKAEIRSGSGELFIRKGDKLYLVGKSIEGLNITYTITYTNKKLDCYGIKLQEVKDNVLDSCRE